MCCYLSAASRPFSCSGHPRDSDLISNVARAGGFGLLLPFILYGLVRSFVPKPPVQRFSLRSTSNLLLLFILFYTVLHVLTWALVRYRLPVDAVLMVYAGLAFADLAAWLGNRLPKASQNANPAAEISR